VQGLMTETNAHVPDHHAAPVATGAERKERTYTFAPDSAAKT
jgi:hypothetical protein